MINERRLGRTGLSVSEIGYGAWGIGGSMWPAPEDDESRARAAPRDRPRAELHRHRRTSTATGTPSGWSARSCASATSGSSCRARSRRRTAAGPRRTASTPTRRSRPTTSASGPSARSATSGSTCSTSSSSTSGTTSGSAAGAGSRASRRWRDEGKIRFFGVSINDLQPGNAIRLIETGAVDTVQVIYNVFEQAPEDELFAACEPQRRRDRPGALGRGLAHGPAHARLDVPRGRLPHDYFSGARSLSACRRARAPILDDLGISSRGPARGGAALRALGARRSRP